MRFVDQTRIFVKSGDGGNGCVSFRREKFVEFGGPNGGDGGRGGHVHIVAIPGLNTLVDYRYKRHFKARKGQHGMGKNMTGANGDDITLEVPVGTQIFDEDQEFMIADLAKAGDAVVIAKGGDGGLGNTHFKSSITRAPRRSTPGYPGEERWLILRLKLLADAGLVGLPNAGKSTFLSAVTRAKPKIADYPFTTMAPQLGVVGFQDKEFVLADIPGLIEGASEGVGLGHRFLGHVERCGVLLHLVDGTSDTVLDDFYTIMDELEAYSSELTEKPMIIGLNKADALSEEDIAEKLELLSEATDNPVVVLSAATGIGVPQTLSALWDVVGPALAERAALEAAAQVEDLPDPLPPSPGTPADDTSAPHVPVNSGWSPL